MLAPSKTMHKENPSSDLAPETSPEKVAMYENQYPEGYNIPDPEHEAWLKIAHPDTKLTTVPVTKLIL